MFGSLAQALSVPEEDLADLLERGVVSLEMGRDEQGHPFVLATHGEGATRRVARIYKDGILHLGARPDSGGVPKDAPGDDPS